MATVISDSIISPLGFSAEETLDAILAGRTGLRRHNPSSSLPFAYTASLFDAEDEKIFMVQGLSRFESLALASIRKALEGKDVPLDSRTALILSSTKGNVGDYDGSAEIDGILLSSSVRKIAKEIGLATQPITVCNACVSGISALMLANRLLFTGACEYAIVCGADVQSEFIISGFNSLKALDPNECRPFDIERLGLNLGEAAAAIVLRSDTDIEPDAYKILAACGRNDALHVTNPSPQGEGCLQAINGAMIDNAGLAQINAHGTATMFNDQMESKSISRAGLSEVPVNALKGSIGHTMGAAGIVEAVLTMHALNRGIVIGTKGFEEIGVSGKINISPENRVTERTSFLKIISGFGGCNCAMLFGKAAPMQTECESFDFTVLHNVRLSPSGAFVDGERLGDFYGPGMLTAIYKEMIGDYSKYYKMDHLSRLAFVATELLLQREGDNRPRDIDSLPIVFFSRAGSVKTDAEYISTIKNADEFYPSPSLFVYTLPNISVGEVAIRNKFRGETLFVMLDRKDAGIIDSVNRAMLCDANSRSLLSGWIDYIDDDNFEADIILYNKIKKNQGKS